MQQIFLTEIEEPEKDFSNDIKKISEKLKDELSDKRQHHERHNGTGYPKKLRGDDIHMYGRICSVADVFDALVSKRPYKTQKTPFDALKIMKEEMLDHFHKEVFQAFVMLFI